MSSPKVPPYILQELPDITECINYPIKNVQRIKYTCFDTSKSLIAFGATSGGIYIFNRSPCEFVQLIPSKDGAITRLSISLDEKHIAFANGKGVVTITKCDQSLMSSHTMVVSKEHQGNEVTCIVWSRNMVFAGDDVGQISVLQLQSFIAKTMFHSSSQIIMNLDSRVCQLDVKNYMLLVSTLTRCYICDTSQEQYRQIGQKLRDGEYGACFVNKDKCLENGCVLNEDLKEIKSFNVIDENEKFAIGKELQDTLIYSARPSSRLWEASIDGTVRRTHQFKQVLAREAMNVLSLDAYNKEEMCIESLNSEGDGQSINFPKIYSLNSAIFSFKKDALYFLDIQDDENTVWFDKYKDIVDCKVNHDCLYIWLANGTIVNLRFMKIEKFLLTAYLDEKFKLCAQICVLFTDYLLSKNLSGKFHILSGLKEKVTEETLKEIHKVIEKFENLKSAEATQMKSGIYVVDNTYAAQTSLQDNGEIKPNDDNMFGTLHPEALQTLKDLSVSVTDKISSSKKILKDKWEEMKQLSTEKPVLPDISNNIPKRIPPDNFEEQTNPIEFDKEIIYKESSQKAIIDSSLETDNTCKLLYQYFRLSQVGKVMDDSELITIIENKACDIKEIHEVMLLLEQYCLCIGAVEESKFVPNSLFLTYLTISPKRSEFMNTIINDDVLYKYFVESCVTLNMKSQKLNSLGCECGYPLPFNKTNQPPVFSEIIDEFIEKQWSSQTRNQCYEICRRMPYLWRKILHLRRNEDLFNVLRLLLQMLDESLLHSFLPQFTLDTWDRAIELFATLHANLCLNCNKKFDNVSVKDTLSWDDIGALMIKSIGGRKAIKVMEKHANLIEPGELTMTFYHSCILVSLYEKYDATIVSRLTDTIYRCYEFEDSRLEICNLLRNSLSGQIKNTALPLIVAAKTTHWGLTPLTETITSQGDQDTKEAVIKNVSLNEIIDNLPQITSVTDCVLCGLPLENEVLIQDGGLWVFKCGHVFHGECLNLHKVKLCPCCVKV